MHSLLQHYRQMHRELVGLDDPLVAVEYCAGQVRYTLLLMHSRSDKEESTKIHRWQLGWRNSPGHPGLGMTVFTSL